MDMMDKQKMLRLISLRKLHTIYPKKTSFPSFLYVFMHMYKYCVRLVYISSNLFQNSSIHCVRVFIIRTLLTFNL